eukprot:gene3737-4676_t
MEDEAPGSDQIVRTLLASGIDVCFANPGTTEMCLVASFDKVKGFKCVLGLHENVVTGAADGYARMTNKAAMTLLHLGVGLTNGMANLHNAKRALSPMINVIGEMATWHIDMDPLLGMDIEGVASAVSGLVKSTKSSSRLVQDVAEAVAHTKSFSTSISRVATLVVPHNVQREPAWYNAEAIERIAATRAVKGALEAESTLFERELAVEEITCGGAGTARFLEESCQAFAAAPGRSKALFLGSLVLRDDGHLAIAARIAAHTGCALLCENAFARVDRGEGRPNITRLPYFPSDAKKELAKYSVVMFVGTRVPVAMFGYTDGISSLVDYKTQRIVEVEHTQDFPGVLQFLEKKLGACAATPEYTVLNRPAIPSGSLTGAKISAVLAALQPEGTILVDESLTSGGQYWDYSAGCPKFSHLTLTGGAIGIGPALSVGCAVACPERQSLWTQAREQLNVITVICANSKYQILKIENQKQSLPGDGLNGLALTDLGTPKIEWVQLAAGMGVDAVSVSTAEELATHLQAALDKKGPFLIEALC